MQKKYFFQTGIILFFLLFFCVSVFAQSLSINLVIVNGSEERKKEEEIKYYLPKELKHEDIVNIGDLNLDFDVEKSAYYVFGKFNFAPKESKTLKIEVKDVWKVKPQEIEILKDQINRNLESLQSAESYEAAVLMKGNMFKKLDYITERQDKFSGDIERRIEEYRANMRALEDIASNAYSVEYLQSATVPKEEEGTVKLVIEVENPSKKEEQDVTHKHYLPKEIRSNHVLDSQGFDVRFDVDRGQAYLTKEEKFQPGETKRYIVVLKNAWDFSDTVLDVLEDRTERALEGITKAEEGEIYASSANFLSEKIYAEVSAIRVSQTEKKPIKEQIGLFRLNQKRYEKADEALKQMERLLALVTAKKLKELENLKKGKVKNILKKIKALRGVAAISRTLFGTRPTITATWKVIWGALVFVAIFTSIHFFTWRSRSKYMGEEFAAETSGELKEVGEESDEEEGKEEKST